jgi:MurNAc alpha-1-phosphate uridylyltransferase
VPAAVELKIPAMLLAAGRGQRMRPLTDRCPKPLLPVAGRPLMQWALQALSQGACNAVVINTAWLGEQISDYFGAHVQAAQGDASPAMASLDLHYSHEGRDFGQALETAGGIARALPLLCPVGQSGDLFWVLAGDVFAPDFRFEAKQVAHFAASDDLAHVWLVPNPAHHPRGDFGLSADGRALNLPADHPGPRWTYATIGLYRRALFQPPWCAIPPGNPEGEVAPLGPLLRAAMDQGRVSASVYTGRWTDVGTPERLQELNQAVLAQAS